MKYIPFSSSDKKAYRLVFLNKYLRANEMHETYLTHLQTRGISKENVLAVEIPTLKGVKEAKEFLSELLPGLLNLSTDYVIVTDAQIFKVLTKSKRVDNAYGYALPCVADGCEHITVMYIPSPHQLKFAPDLRERIDFVLDSLVSHWKGTYVEPGTETLKFEEYPDSPEEILAWLERLMKIPHLTADIEAFSLKHYNAGIGTISFAWNKHEGIAFAVDKDRTEAESRIIREYLREFFIAYAKAGGKLKWHMINYDVYVLIYQLFMKDILDTGGLLYGLDVMLAQWDCTKLISYLATNSTSGNELGLKENAQEFMGNYAEDDIKDINLIETPRLLRYNLKDATATWYVYEKHWDTLVNDQQLDIYERYFKPWMVDIIQMQLTGLPIFMDKVIEGKAKMQADCDAAMHGMTRSPLVKQLITHLNVSWVEWKNSQLKKKRVTIDDANEEFNPDSGPQIQKLLYTLCNLPVIALTKSKQPSVDKDTLKSLKFHTQDPDILAFLDSLIAYRDVEKILNSFIPAFESAPMGPDGHHYLFGVYNLGGTLSGRLSSSDPNMQNLPATGSKYAKLVKKMFGAPKGWLFVGLDFNSLEDRISALTTKDPNKLKVYTDGYDGHSLRAYYYFTDQMPDIDPNSVDSINSIQKKYNGLRQESKAPTFALTYQGTYITLMNNLGWSKDKAEEVEQRYHSMYQVSTKWVMDQLEQAKVDGYITTAFGLRVRTPLLAAVDPGGKMTPTATAEGRSAGNALGQGWCMLNNRAVADFMRDVRKSKYQLDVRVCAQIHDASYYLIRDNVDVVHWVNENLVKHVKWQEHPLIAHDEVKLGGDLSVFHPSWADEMIIPNGATPAQIMQLAEEHAA